MVSKGEKPSSDQEKRGALAPQGSLDQSLARRVRPTLPKITGSMLKWTEQETKHGKKEKKAACNGGVSEQSLQRKGSSSGQ